MHKALGFILGLALAAPAFSQSFTPTRPIEVVVHTGPGGGTDVLARAMVLMMDMVRNIWSWDQNLALNDSLLDALLGLFGLK